jgi:type II secretory pathway component PulF
MNSSIDIKNKQPSSYRIRMMRISLKERAVFTKYLSLLLKSGLPLSEALEIITSESKGPLLRALKFVSAEIAQGRALADSFRRFPRLFSPLLINLSRAGETSGTLPEALERAAEQMNREKELRSKIISALTYPAIILAAALIVGMSTVFFILPKIIPMFEGMKIDLPLSTRLLIRFANFTRHNYVQLLAFSGGLIIFIPFAVRLKFFRPAIDFFILKLPLAGKIARLAILADFSRIMATFLKSGLGLREALKESADAAGNLHYKNSIERVRLGIEGGLPFSESLEGEKKYFPRILASMVKVGERSGKLEETLGYSAQIFEEELENLARTLASLMEPAILLLIGLIVGGLVISIITPIYELTGKVH